MVVVTVPTPILRSIGALVAGGIIAAAGYLMAAVVALLVMHGIPLGSAGGPPSSADVSAHLAIASVASLAGGLAAVRLAGYRPLHHALLLGGFLGAAALLGFSKPASTWPAWFPFGMAMACVCGALLASRLSSGIRQP